MIPRRKAYIFVTRRKNDDGEKIRESGANYEGKIKEDGTISSRFWKLLLSAHWLGDRFRHHGFEGSRAGISRKALASLDFERHHSSKSGLFGGFGNFRSGARS